MADGAEQNLETLCRLAMQRVDLMERFYSEKAAREENDRLKNIEVQGKLFAKIERFQTEIDTRVEKCSKRLSDEVKDKYVEKTELADKLKEERTEILIAMRKQLLYTATLIISVLSAVSYLIMITQAVGHATGAN